VVLKWEAAYASQYKVQISSDATFTENETVSTQTASDGGTDDLTVSGTGRYIRILCTTKALTPYGYSLFEIEAYGSASTAKSSTASKKEVPEEGITAFTMYPNPASDYIQLSLPEKLNNKVITIYNLYGKMMMQYKLDATTEESLIDINQLPKGIYILNLNSDEKNWTKKLIKE
jgi:hypothetical protein